MLAYRRKKTRKSKSSRKQTRRRLRRIGGGPNNNNNLNLRMLIPSLRLPPAVKRPATPQYNEPTPVPDEWKQPRAENVYATVSRNEHYPEKLDICPPLYISPYEAKHLYRNNNSSNEEEYEDKPFAYPVLTREIVMGKKLKLGTNYIFAIKVSEPTKIYFYLDNASGSFRDREEWSTPEKAANFAERLERKFRGNFVTNWGSHRRITHNCLTNNEPAICAGDFELENSQYVTINNNSGHYYPQGECLNYTKHLFQELGFKKVEVNPLQLEQ
jgi:hypothetical protein